MKLLILRLTMFAAIGVVTRIAGITVSHWEFWAILSAAVVIGLISYYEGRQSK